MMKMATITTAEFAAELGTTPKVARKFLRADFRDRDLADALPGKGARWAIEKRDVKALKGRYAKWAAAEAEARAARAQKAAEDAQAAVDEVEDDEVA
jgi:predicted transcriptional regulator